MSKQKRTMDPSENSTTTDLPNTSRRAYLALFAAAGGVGGASVGAAAGDEGADDVIHEDTYGYGVGGFGLSPYGSGEEGPSLDEYTNDDGFVETDDLRDAISDWRNGDISLDLLQDVIDSWRGGEPLE